MSYQSTIHRLAPTVNPAAVEASMRLAYGTLGHLSEDTFRAEIALFAEISIASPGYGEKLADSMGLAADYAAWECKVWPTRADGTNLTVGEMDPITKRVWLIRALFIAPPKPVEQTSMFSDEAVQDAIERVRA